MTTCTKILLVLLIAAVLPGSARAFDGSRKGFILGLGGGIGSAARWSDSNSSRSSRGVAASIKAGAGLSEQVLLYYSEREIFFSNFLQGMTAAAVSYFFNPEAPSFFLSGEVGFGFFADLHPIGGGVRPNGGFGFTIGAGAEMSRHFVLEANYMRADLGYNISNFTITACWLGF